MDRLATILTINGISGTVIGTIVTHWQAMLAFACNRILQSSKFKEFRENTVPKHCFSVIKV